MLLELPSELLRQEVSTIGRLDGRVQLVGRTLTRLQLLRLHQRHGAERYRACNPPAKDMR
jgi:hypothetical protein